MQGLKKKEESYVIRSCDSATQQLIYSLRYRVYKKINAVDDHSSEQFIDAYDTSNNSFSYLYSKDGKQIGSIRVSVYSKKFEWEAVPAHKMFSQEIRSELGENASLLEVTRLVIDPAFQSLTPSHFFKLLRAVILMNKLHQPDYVIGTIVPEQVSFYKKFFQFQPISVPKTVPGLNVPPSVLVAVKGSLFNEISDQKTTTQVLEQHISQHSKSGVMIFED